MSAILNAEPPDVGPALQVPPALERVARRCLEKDRGSRFSSARDFAFSLEAISTLSSSTEARSLPARQAWPARSQNWIETGTLARVPMNGGTPRELLPDASGADWSPDGEQLAVTRFIADKNIWRVLLEWPFSRLA